MSPNPLLLLAVLAWWRGLVGCGLESAFAARLGVKPIALIMFELSHVPLVKLAPAHLIGGVRHFSDKPLGKYRAYAGCGGREAGTGGCE